MEKTDFLNILDNLNKIIENTNKVLDRIKEDSDGKYTAKTVRIAHYNSVKLAEIIKNLIDIIVKDSPNISPEDYKNAGDFLGNMFNQK